MGESRKFLRFTCAGAELLLKAEPYRALWGALAALVVATTTQNHRPHRRERSLFSDHPHGLQQFQLNRGSLLFFPCKQPVNRFAKFPADGHPRLLVPPVLSSLTLKTVFLLCAGPCSHLPLRCSMAQDAATLFSSLQTTPLPRFILQNLRTKAILST